MFLFLLSACPNPADSGDSTAIECDACDGDCLEEYIPADGGQHTSGGIDYEDKPPTGGDHDPCWAEWGVHEDEIPDENWVHNLEHGGVVFLYDCPEGCPDEVAALASYVESVQGNTALLSPYSDLEHLFAAVAWENRIQMGCFHLTSLSTFYEEHHGRAPENVLSDPSASCQDDETDSG